MQIEVYEARRGLARRKQWRWRARHANGRIMADSGEGYANRAELRSALITLFADRHPIIDV